jgi:hypothetical protein
MRRRSMFLALLLATPFAALGAQDDRTWSGQLTPYLWGVGVGGTIRPFTGAPTLELDKSVFELLEDLKAAFFITGYVRRQRLVLLGDLSYSTSARSGVVPPGVPASGKLSQTSLTGLAGIRARHAQDVTVDLLGGVRAWWINTSVEVPLAGVQASPELDFVDPIVAARSNIRLGLRWSTILYGDVGGLGVGSRITGQLLATVNFRATGHIYLSGGYRYLAVDYDEGGTRADVVLAGPLLGVTWRF